MSAVAKALKQGKNNNFSSLLVQVTLSGNYVTDGVTLDLSAAGITDPNLICPVLPGPQITPYPILPGVHAASLGGYYAQVVPGADTAHYKLTFWESQDVQLPQAAFPAAITGGTLILELVF
jgi:hypothetical protein